MQTSVFLSQRDDREISQPERLHQPGCCNQGNAFVSLTSPDISVAIPSISNSLPQLTTDVPTIPGSTADVHLSAVASPTFPAMKQRFKTMLHHQPDRPLPFWLPNNKNQSDRQTTQSRLAKSSNNDDFSSAAISNADEDPFANQTLKVQTVNFDFQQNLSDEPDVDPVSSCIVCWERKRQILFVPCGHYLLCFACARQQWLATCGEWQGGEYLSCGICSARVKGLVRVFQL